MIYIRFTLQGGILLQMIMRVAFARFAMNLALAMTFAVMSAMRRS
jgi:hypothetical protein